MRALFTFVGGRGHLEPLIPVARAVASAGHEVAIAGAPWLGPVIEARGFTAFALGLDTAPAPEITPLLALDAAREDRVIAERFAGSLARERADAVLARGSDWRPDVVVSDEVDFGAMVAAEVLGLPQVTVLVTAAGRLVRPALVAPPLDRLRADHGLPPDPDFVRPGRHLVLVPFPASFRDAGTPLPDTAMSIRPTAPDSPAAGLAMPADLGRARPLVYVTLGTVFNLESGDLFSRVLAGLRDLPVDVVATVGSALDPAAFGPQPDHIHLVRDIPQWQVLPRCHAVLSHGGSGTVIGALAHGLPQLMIPMGADQPHNAERGAALGVSSTLDAVAVTPAEVAASVSAVLADTGMRRRAEVIAAEIAALPAPSAAVPLLEALVARPR